MHFTVISSSLLHRQKAERVPWQRSSTDHWYNRVRYGRKQKYSWLSSVLNPTINKVKTITRELCSINCSQMIYVFIVNCWHWLRLYSLTYINSSNKMHLLRLSLFKPSVLIPYLTLFSTRLPLLGPELHLKCLPLPSKFHYLIPWIHHRIK